MIVGSAESIGGLVKGVVKLTRFKVWYNTGVGTQPRHYCYHCNEYMLSAKHIARMGMLDRHGQEDGLHT
jgi:hypothetical protein